MLTAQSPWCFGNDNNRVATWAVYQMARAHGFEEEGDGKRSEKTTIR